MNNTTVSNSIRFIVLVMLQVVVLNKINFLGYINPYLYLYFILLLPFSLAQWRVLLYSFFIGILIDVFEDSGGIHAGASLVIAYIRPFILKSSFGVIYEFQTIKFSQTSVIQRITYFSILVFIHHFVLFLLEVFNFSHILLVLRKTFFSGIFTLLLLIIVTVLFQKKNK